MRIIIDTHALVWWFNEPSRLSQRALAVISDASNAILVSAVSAWELAIKVKLRKLSPLPFAEQLRASIEQEGFEELPASIEQASRAGLLPLHHRDPFDRLLVGQGLDLRVPILSADVILDQYEVERVW